MPHEIIMPQLGMAQDAGVIVAWHKSAGDAIAADDVLMEVETDKATVEVPAGRAGFLAEVRFEAGAEVPIGEVVAVISDSAGSAATATTPAKDAAVAPPPAPAQPTEPAPAPEPQAKPEKAGARAAPPAEPGRVLASPKARRLALERGMNLEALVRQGASQPIHAADLDRLAAAPFAAPAVSMLRGTVDRAAFDALLARAAAEPTPPHTAAIWGAFASGAWRTARNGEATGAIIAVCRTLDGATAATALTLRDADRSGLSALAGEEADGAPDFAIFDLSATRLSEYRPADTTAPVLTVSADGHDRYAVALSFSEAALSLDIATAFLDGFARRIEDPLRHLL